MEFLEILASKIISVTSGDNLLEGSFKIGYYKSKYSSITYYFFKNRKYRVDFFIPKFNLLIEIKDEHIWHKKEVLTGKWDGKYKSAVDYANTNGLKYKLVFYRELNELKETLLRYSLDL